MNGYFLFFCMIVSSIYAIQGNPGDHNVQRRQACDDPNMCRSKWGYCGTGDDFCGDGCTAGPCHGGGGGGGGGDESIITNEIFACAFDAIDEGTRANRLNGLRNSGWAPSNTQEAAVFLGHVCHETDGLKTLREYCAPGCGPDYAGSWCSIQGAPGKWYYGRGWFQLSWPCNYYAAGQSLNIDLLNNPDIAEQDEAVAVKTAVWFYTANNMGPPAKEGDFAATTRIINGKLECDHGPGYNNQLARVATYKRIRNCFNLGEPTINPIC